MLDGVPIEGTFAPRDDPSTMEDFVLHEQLMFPKTELAAMLRESLQDQDQLIVHVVGYPATAAMLDAMRSAGGPVVWARRRVRFEHGDGLTPDLIPRSKAMGIVVVQNPTHFDVAKLNPDLGGVFEKTKTQPLRSLLAAGIPVAFGSDGPTNPFLNIMFASLDPNRPSEAISREQAVVAYTLGSAYAEFAEKQKGSLEPGKLADFAVLSQDIFTVPSPDLPKTTSVLTLVGGKVIYDVHHAVNDAVQVQFHPEEKIMITIQKENRRFFGLIMLALLFPTDAAFAAGSPASARLAKATTRPPSKAAAISRCGSA
jgi:hypothetical protein